MGLSIAEVIAGALKPVSEVIDSLHTSREEKDAAKIELAVAQGRLDAEFTNAQKDIIVAEATEDSVVTLAARDEILAATTVDDVVTGSTVEPVSPVAAVDLD